MPIEYIASIYYNGYCQGGNPETKNPPPVAADGRKEADMKCVKGTWYYQGRAYESLNAALKAAWASR